MAARWVWLRGAPSARRGTLAFTSQGEEEEEGASRTLEARSHGVGALSCITLHVSCVCEVELKQGVHL